MKKLFFPAAVLMFLFLVLSGCPPNAPAPASHSFSGKVIDFVSGQPVSGVTVEFAGVSSTTSADGGFSIDLGQQTGTLSGSYAVRKSGYAFTYMEPVTADAGSDLQLTLRLVPLDVSAYPTHTVTVTILDSTSSEITNGTSVSVTIFNSAGGAYTWNQSYTTGGLSVQSPTFGSDCLVQVYAGSYGFMSMEECDLSASPASVTVAQDTANTATIAVSGAAAGNTGGVVLTCSYGSMLGAGLTLSSSANAQVPVTNPYGYNGYWVQSQKVANWIGTSDKTFVGSSTPSSLAAFVTLPAPSLSLGPTEEPDIGSLGYATGTLSLTPVAGASLYQYTFVDAGGKTVGGIYTSSASLGFPEWLKSQLSGSTLTVRMGPADSDIAFDLSVVGTQLAGASGFPPLNIHFASLAPNGGSMYEKPLTF